MQLEMVPRAIIELLVGKTISKIEYHTEWQNTLVIESIHLSDGTEIDLGGNCDKAHLTGITLKNGTFVIPASQE